MGIFMEDIICPECGKECYIVPLQNEFDYADGAGNRTHYPPDYGTPVSHCCECPIERKGKHEDD